MMRKGLSLAVIAGAVMGCWPAAAAPMLRASCMEGNQVVYREDIPADAPAERRAQIIARNPAAMCVFLELQDPARIGTALPSSAPGGGLGRLPDALVAAAAGKSVIPDADLSAALSAITGADRSAAPIRPLAAAVQPGSRSLDKAPSSDGSAGTLALTLGIYKGMTLVEVMEHWRQMSAGTKVLSKMTPTVTTAEDVMMLSIEGVTDGEAGQLCDEAQERGVGCLAAY